MAKVRRRVLFVCEGNLHRSPTVERLYSAIPGIDARSAGLSDLARVQVNDELLFWADVIFVMERRLRQVLKRRFTVSLEGKELVCLNVPDDFQRDEPKLIDVLVERLTPHLGPPAL
ncbi:phosphotyrosine protein phosphatase [Limnoglobus roseus]|uniref:Phosphotyrosine protein phosphatase n=1 Tax=Limnoglobus roseus TaxID=2598579 RepID=A0A5C1AA14_9BACT|nr:phosphotyrosine protein phosphatase [Limnoglobus roseus]QEL15013.1 phosphotyrosine protein phosphatase [Limnoglobus roseus]